MRVECSKTPLRVETMEYWLIAIGNEIHAPEPDVIKARGQSVRDGHPHSVAGQLFVPPHDEPSMVEPQQDLFGKWAEQLAGSGQFD